MPDRPIRPTGARVLDLLDLRLYLCPATIKGQTDNIYQKLGVHSRRDTLEKTIHLGIRRR